MKLIGIKDFCGHACIINLEDVESITPYIERYSASDSIVNGYLICFKSNIQVRITEEQFNALLDIVDKM